MYLFLHSSLSTRFDFSRVRIAFSGLLAFTWGFSNWFYSGLKKRSWKKIENFWSKIDFKIEIEKFSKFSKKSRFFRFFHFFRKFSKNRKSKKVGFQLKIFRKISKKMKKSKNLDFFENFEIFRKFFDLDFEIDFRSKNFNIFDWFFLNRFYFFRSFIISRLEVARRPQGRAFWLNV